MTTFQALFLFAMFLVTLKVYKTRKRKNYNLPPGPRGYPFLGNNFQIANNPHLQLSKWAEKYGKIYTITLGNGIPALVINDMTTIKQIFSLTESTGRFITEIHDALFDGPYGVVNSDGTVWQEQREFCFKKLKSFGFDKCSIVEPKMHLQITKLCDWLEEEMNSKGKVYLSQISKETTGNTIWEISTGEQIGDNVHLMEDQVQKLQKVSNFGLPFFPWIKCIAPQLSGYNELMETCRKIHDYVKGCFAKYENNNGNDDANHMVAAYIEHMIKMKNNVNSSFHGENGFRHSVQSVCALLVAGVESTATTLHWLIFYLCAHPEVQKRVQKEIDEKIGNDRRPSLGDRNSMPYSEAVILESLRMSSIGPSGLLHRLLEDVTFHEYKLPKDLILVANIYNANYDKSVWGDPEKFRPDRFLDSKFGKEDGVTLSSLKHFVATFQAGKRVCPGEQMAKEILFLFLTGLLQQFSFLMEDGATAEMYMKPVVGLMLTPDNSLGVRAIKRNF